ncbi:MAG: hypothetical protein JNK05_23260 [Myxococcales bacterium]|nr:hypothetical protein [Myxococcales bacterium]
MPSSEALSALSRALHGVLTPFVAHGASPIANTVHARLPDGTLHAIQPASDVWTQQSANAALDGLSPDALDFDLASTSILEEVKHALFPNDRGHLEARLVALDVQASGPRVEPKLPSADATLIVCLPSRFFGGKLVAASRGVLELFWWANEIESDPDPHRVRWAAFSPAVKHQFERVSAGSRVSLVFALTRSGAAAEKPVDDRAHTEAIRSALRGLRSSIDAGAVLAVPCEGAYATVERFVRGSNELEPQDDELLIGRDARLAAAAHAQGLRVRIRPYLVDVRQDETLRLERFIAPERAPNASESRKVIVEALKAYGEPVTPDKPSEELFVIDRPRFAGSPKRYELDSRTPRPLFDNLPAIEPAQVGGVVRADSPAAALYTFAALLVDNASAAGAVTHESKTSPELERPAPKAAPESAPTAPKRAKPEKPEKPEKPVERDAPKPKAAVKVRAAKSAPEPKKPNAKAAAKPAAKPAKAANATAKRAAPSDDAPRAKIKSRDAVADLRKGIAAILARVERGSKG